MTRAAAVALTVALTTTTTTPPPARANPIDDFNVAALLPVGDFALQAAGWTHRDPRSMLAALEGYSSISGVASDELVVGAPAGEHGPERASRAAAPAERAGHVGGRHGHHVEQRGEVLRRRTFARA